MKRSYAYLAAATVLIGGVVVAIVLPHHCIHCFFEDMGPCHTFCPGPGVILRVGIAVGGLIMASTLALVGRRVQR